MEDNTTQVIDGSVFFIVVLLALGAFLVWRYFFANRPNLSKNAWKEENQATHPSEYQNLYDNHVGVGSVKVKPVGSEHRARNRTNVTEESSTKESLLTEPNIFSQPDLVSMNHEHSTSDQSGNDIVASSSHKPVIIILHLQCAQNTVFSGESIMRSANDLGLIYSRSGVFHYYSIDDADEPWFTVANMLEPGIFNLAAMDSFSTVGISFFMQTEKSLGSSITRFEAMVATANAMARKLGGKVMDSSHHQINEDHLEQIRNRIRGSFHVQDNYIVEPA